MKSWVDTWVCNQADEPVFDRVSRSVRTQVMTQVRRRVRLEIDDQVMTLVRDKARIRSWKNCDPRPDLAPDS